MMNRSRVTIFCFALLTLLFQELVNVKDVQSESNIKYIVSDKYHIKIAVPEGLDKKATRPKASPLERVIDGYANDEGDSIFISETIKSPYDEMSEEEFFNLSLAGIKRIGEIDSSGQITIDNKSAYCVTFNNTAVNPNIYQGSCILRIKESAIVIYVTYGDKNTFRPNWEYIIKNSTYDDVSAENSNYEIAAIEDEISKLVSMPIADDPKGKTLTRLLTKYVATLFKEKTQGEIYPIIVEREPRRLEIGSPGLEQLGIYQQLSGSNIIKNDVSETLVIRTGLDSGEGIHKRLLDVYMKKPDTCEAIFGLKFCVSVEGEALPVIKIAHQDYIYKRFTENPKTFRADINAQIPKIINRFQDTIPGLRKVVLIPGQASTPYIVEQIQETSSVKELDTSHSQSDVKGEYSRLVSDIRHELSSDDQTSKAVRVFKKHALKLLKKWEQEAPKEVVNDIEIIRGCVAEKVECLQSTIDAIHRLKNRGVEGRGAALMLVNQLDSGYVIMPPELLFWKSATEVRIEAAKALVNMNEAGAVALVYAYETGYEGNRNHIFDDEGKALFISRLVTSNQALQYIFSLPISDENIVPSGVWIRLLMSSKPEVFTRLATDYESAEQKNDEVPIKVNVPWYTNEFLVSLLIVAIIGLGYKFTR